MSKIELKIKDMKNNCDSENSLIVAELNGFLQVFTSSGEILPFNTNTVIEDSVDGLMKVTASFYCRLGEVKK